MQTLIENDLVDELRLMVFPVMIGGGLRFYPDDREKLPFELTDSQAFSNGVLVNRYAKVSA